MRHLRAPSKPTILAVLIVLSVVSTLMGPRFSAALRRPVSWLVAPLGDAAMAVSTAIKGGLGLIAEPEELVRLRRRAEQLEGQLVAAARELGRLRRQQRGRASLFAATGDFPGELIPARVIAGDPLPYTRSRLLTQMGERRDAPPGSVVTTRLVYTGRKKGLPPRLAAMGANAMVGELMESGNFTARVRLVTDRGFETRAAILRKFDPDKPRPIRILRKGAAVETTLTPENRGLIPVKARGDGAGSLRVEQVPEYHNVLPGDLLLSTGRTRRLPVSVPIGRVAEVHDSGDHPQYSVLKVEPIADIEALRDVYIVYPLPLHLPEDE